MNYYELFKTDFFTGLSNLTKKIWKKVLLAYAIYYVSSMVLAGIFALIAFMGVVDLNMFSDMVGSSSPEDSLLMIEYITEMLMTPEFLVSLIILMIIIIILASWNYLFAFLACDSEVKDERYNFTQLFKLSFSVQVFKFAGVMFLLNIIIATLFVIAAFSASFSIWLAVLLFLMVCVLSTRFLLVIPAYVIGNYDFGSSFAFSFYHINWPRAFKIFGIMFLGMLVIFGVSFLIGLISMAFSFIPLLGSFIQMGINVLLSATMMAVSVGALVGLYYRYADGSTTIPTEEESPSTL
ncbi:MAG: hypothetical protein KDD41_01050 [Flavobacteriales bacterium]|nr:hypothetical protein [Flavobacteriales bacterium]